MIHKMNLDFEPFKLIKDGTKTVELRLNDKKRQLINIGDLIEFTNRDTLEKMQLKVVALYKYPNFEELYKHFNKIEMGYREDEVASFLDMEQYYSKDAQKKYGVLGIQLEKYKAD